MPERQPHVGRRIGLDDREARAGDLALDSRARAARRAPASSCPRRARPTARPRRRRAARPPARGRTLRSPRHPASRIVTPRRACATRPCRRCCSAVRGRRMVTVVPCPGSDCSSIVPPCASTNCLASGRPRPTAASSPPRPSTVRWKRSNTARLVGRRDAAAIVGDDDPRLVAVALGTEQHPAALAACRRWRWR